MRRINGEQSETLARRGGCNVTVTAPEPRDGFKFVGWEKVANEDDIVEVYKAVYEKEAKAEVSMLQEEAANVAETLEKDHVCHRPEPGQWTKMTSCCEDRTITVHYEGCYGYVSFATFKCDLNMCEGFNGAESETLARRGECEVKVTAPAPKAGYRFVGWERTEHPEGEDSNFDVYTALYELIK